MSQDEFTKLYKYIEKRFDSIDQKLDTKASQTSLDRLTGTIDSFIKRLDDSEIEQASRDLQFDRLLVWARAVSRKTGVPLKNL
jgi:hypothetical protein